MPAIRNTKSIQHTRRASSLQGEALQRYAYLILYYRILAHIRSIRHLATNQTLSVGSSHKVDRYSRPPLQFFILIPISHLVLGYHLGKKRCSTVLSNHAKGRPNRSMIRGDIQGMRMSTGFSRRSCVPSASSFHEIQCEPPHFISS